MAPGAIPHETHKLSFAVFTLCMVSNAGFSAGRLRFKSRTITPGTIMPFVRYPFMAAWTNPVELCGCIETVSIGTAPWTQQHTFRYRLVATYTSKDRVQNLTVPLQESTASNFLPFDFFLSAFFKTKAVCRFLGRDWDNAVSIFSAFAKRLEGSITSDCF